MKVFSYVVLALCLVCSVFAQDRHLTIINGTNAEPHAFPFIISLQNEGTHFCGGSLINKNTVITAAHCVRNLDPKTLSVVLGLHRLHENKNQNTQTIKVSKFVLHPFFSRFTWTNDIAILHLEHSAQFNEHVQPILLPERDSTPNGEVFVAGWGSVTEDLVNFPNILQMTTLKVRNFEDCTQTCNPILHEGLFCASDKLSQPGGGDSGGPLLQNGKLLGVVSHGWGGACPTTGFYTRVSHYLDFITTNTLK